MDFKKVKAPTTTVTRNLMDFCRDTNNLYESVAIIAKRSNQIAQEMKEELNKKLQGIQDGIGKVEKAASSKHNSGNNNGNGEKRGGFFGFGGR